MADPPLTEGVTYKLPDLHERFFVIRRDTLLASAVLLAYLTIKYYHNNHGSQVFHGAVLGKLETFSALDPNRIGDLFEAFEIVTHIT